MINNQKYVAIVGFGHVGQGMDKIFTRSYIYDPKINERTRRGDEEVRNLINNICDLAIVCVPTPPKGKHEQNIPDDCEDYREVDISIVEEAVAWLRTPLILIKSTIPPGTTDYLKEKYNKRICFSPEFMGEGGYYVPPEYPDPKNPLQHSFMVIGGESQDCDDILDFFIPVMGPAKTYYKCSAVEAELIKYMENTWIATKVTFANEWANICEAFGASYNTVREGWGLDSRVDKMHTAVFRDKRGFSGKCLPKDLHGIIRAVEAKRYNPLLLKSVWGVNQRIRGIEPKWEHKAYGLREDGTVGVATTDNQIKTIKVATCMECYRIIEIGEMCPYCSKEKENT